MIVNRAATGITKNSGTIIEVHEVVSGSCPDNLFDGLPVTIQGSFIIVSYPRSDYARLNRIIQAKMTIKDVSPSLAAARVLSFLING